MLPKIHFVLQKRTLRSGKSQRFVLRIIDADALLLVTEWKEFRMPSFAVLEKTMAGKVIVDGRNIYDKEEVAEHGFVYYKIG